MPSNTAVRTSNLARVLKMLTHYFIQKFTFPFFHFKRHDICSINSLVCVIHFSDQKSYQNVSAYQNLPISFLFAHSLILIFVFCRKMEVCKLDYMAVCIQHPNNLKKNKERNGS
jgi:hypothetical protein